MQIIQNWLNGHQNFIVGVTLYNKFGSNNAFKKLLLRGETSFAKEQLKIELQKLAAVKQLRVTIPKATIVQQKETGEMPETDNAVLQAIKNEWNPLYQKMNLLRHQLDKFDNDNSREAIAYRKPIASEIKRLEKEINAIWEKRNYYEKHGKLPFVSETKVVIPTDPVQHAKLIGNLAKYIRRYRKAMKDNPEDPKAAQFYLEKKAQYKQVTGKDYEEKE